MIINRDFCWIKASKEKDRQTLENCGYQLLMGVAVVSGRTWNWLWIICYSPSENDTSVISSRTTIIAYILDQVNEQTSNLNKKIMSRRKSKNPSQLDSDWDKKMEKRVSETEWKDIHLGVVDLVSFQSC